MVWPLIAGAVAVLILLFGGTAWIKALTFEPSPLLIFGIIIIIILIIKMKGR